VSLQRKTPLKRGGYIVKHRARRLDRETPEEAQYRAWVHTQVCVGHAIDSFHRCMDRLGRPTEHVEQSHIRFNTGMSAKPNELRSLPMCGALHVQWEERKGAFSGLDNFERFAWAEPHIQAHYERFRAAQK